MMAMLERHGFHVWAVGLLLTTIVIAESAQAPGKTPTFPVSNFIAPILIVVECVWIVSDLIRSYCLKQHLRIPFWLAALAIGGLCLHRKANLKKIDRRELIKLVKWEMNFRAWDAVH